MRSKTDSHDRRLASRSGFTLVELLVVIGIALIIISLSAAAAIQVLAYQRSSNTQNTLKTLSDSLDRQWRAVVDKATKEAQGINATSNPGVYALASTKVAPPIGIVDQNIDKRARVIYVKLRLRQEFPTNISEALYPFRLSSRLDPLIPPSSPIYPTNFPNEFPGQGPLPTYGRILRNARYYVPAANESPSGNLILPASVRPPLPAPPIPNTTPATWPVESSICALMSLQQGRGGEALKEDDLGSGIVQTDSISGLKLVVDAWQQPIIFYRWQTPTPYSIDPNDPGNLNNRDVDKNDPVGTYDFTNPKTTFRDPLDPEGVLLDPLWNSQQNYAQGKGVWWFELFCHSVHEFNPNYAARAYYMVPTFVSAGRNNRLGLLQPLTLVIPNAPAGLYPSPLLPDTMVIDPTDPEGSNDNIYSYRLRQGARGD